MAGSLTMCMSTPLGCGWHSRPIAVSPLSPAVAQLAALLPGRHESLEPRRPFGGVEAGGGMAEVAVDLEIVGADAGGLELGHDLGREGGREDLVGARQHVE